MPGLESTFQFFFLLYIQVIECGNNINFIIDLSFANAF